MAKLKYFVRMVACFEGEMKFEILERLANDPCYDNRFVCKTLELADAKSICIGMNLHDLVQQALALWDVEPEVSK
jgi:hypothetical protein